MIDIKVSQNIDADRVLVTETNLNNKKQPTRFYVVPKEKVDEFIDRKNELKNIDYMQKAGSIILSGLVGFTAYVSLFKKPALKAIAGIGAGIATLAGAFAFDKKADKISQNYLLKKTDAYEITNKEDKLAQILGTVNSEQTEELQDKEIN